MKCFYAAEQALHAPASELNRGTMGSPFEAASRAATVATALTDAGIGPLMPPSAFPDAIVARVHDSGFLEFLRTAHDEWRALGRDGDAMPMCWPGTTMYPMRPGAGLDARLGHYCFDIMTPITATSWTAARASVNTALAGAQVLTSDGQGSAFALCRPPGHHAGIAAYGGYCFLNSAAVAAQYLRDNGARRVAVFDPDYHHGNGTQQIFYDRDDVLYVSIHADPQTDFPFYSGFSDEVGSGAGEGFNLNLPLPQGTRWPEWEQALQTALAALTRFAPDALVISLGVDTLEGDPLCHFNLQSDDFARLGQRIARLGLPTLFVLEGGYQLDLIGRNVVRTLQGFLNR